MTNEEILKEDGWVVECESPFEIRHEDGDFATGQAARMVVNQLREDKEAEDRSEVFSYLPLSEDLENEVTEFLKRASDIAKIVATDISTYGAPYKCPLYSDRITAFIQKAIEMSKDED